ncbi:MAG: UDP-N-acetylenolpyruvoylglucosamine reductase, partial [Chitinophagales bacterium]
DKETEQVVVFNKEQCQFAYRESIFKKELRGKHIILSISLVLSKKPKINIEYGAIAETLKLMKVENPTIKDVSDAVIAIRSSKLPNPKEIGNAGSFFKNPVVDLKLVKELQGKYPSLPVYTVDEKCAKLPAAWLIEQAGWKGKSFGNYGVHKNQALVLVNYGGAKGEDIKNLAHSIQADVFSKFGIEISPEVNFI